MYSYDNTFASLYWDDNGVLQYAMRTPLFSDCSQRLEIYIKKWMLLGVLSSIKMLPSTAKILPSLVQWYHCILVDVTVTWCVVLPPLLPSVLQWHHCCYVYCSDTTCQVYCSDTILLKYSAMLLLVLSLYHHLWQIY